MSNWFLEQELKKRGYQAKWDGTRYIREAVRMTVDAPELRGIRASKDIYPAIARAANVDARTVERCIRYAVHKAEPGHTAAGAVHDIAAVVKAYAD